MGTSELRVDRDRKVADLIGQATEQLGGFMKNASEIDYSKLLGFEAIGDEIVGNVDFQDERVAAKLGAKVGADPVNPVAPVGASKE
jgi:hypothetical protein